MRARLLLPAAAAAAVLVGTAGCSLSPGSPATPTSSSPALLPAGSDGTSAVSATPSAPPVSASSIVLVVTPHPDDELEAWAALPESADVYPVFVTMTQGEATANCEPDGYAANQWTAVGEVAPTPTPAGRRTQSCRDARLDSWGRFLEEAWSQGSGTPAERLEETALPVAPLDGLPAAVDGPAGGAQETTARAWVGQRSARLAFSAGDGDTTPDEVRWAVRTVLAERGGALPDLPLLRVLGGTYFNDAPDASVHRADASGTCADQPCTGSSLSAEYEHHDHRAVRDALIAGGTVTTEGTWVTTWAQDPLASQVLSLTPERYEQVMGLGAPLVEGDPTSRQRLGTMQREYGWLGFPDGYWPPSETAVPDAYGNPLVMARTQSFIVLDPAGSPPAG